MNMPFDTQEPRSSMAKPSVSSTLPTPPLTRLVPIVLEDMQAGGWGIPQVRYWIDPHNTNIELIHPMSDDLDTRWLEVGKAPMPDTFWEPLVERRQTIAKEQSAYADQLSLAGFETTQCHLSTATEAGCRHILEYTQRVAPDLLMIFPSLADVHGISHFSAHLATHAQTSVLVIKKRLQTPQEGKNILLAVDGSEASLKAVQKLPQLIHCQDSTVEIITIMNPVYVDVPVIAPYVNTELIDQAMAQNADHILETAKTLLEENGLKNIKTRRILGAPAWELMEYIGQAHPDLVVVGSHNRSGLAAWFLGSISSRMVQYAPCSVLVVR